jgi:hypothetical protein
VGSGYVSAGTPCPGGQYCNNGECGDAVLSDDFEDGEASDWSTFATLILYSSASRSVVASPAAAGTGHSLEIVATNTLLAGYGGGVSRSFTSTPVTEAGFWIRAASNGANITVVFREASTTVLTMGLTSSGYFSVAGTPTATPYAADQWYHVEIRNIDWSAHTFDVYVGGSLVGQGAMEVTTATGLDQIRVQVIPTATGSATVYFDEVTVG